MPVSPNHPAFQLAMMRRHGDMVRSDGGSAANEMFHTLRHPLAGDVTVLAPPLRLGEDGFTPAGPTAPLGSETDAILGELGFSAEEIGKLVGAGVTRRS